MRNLVPVLLLLLAGACSRQEKPIVRTAHVKITVADTVKTVDDVIKSAEAAGGHVSGSEIWRDGDTVRATLTLHVPADKLTSTLASIHGVAKRVEHETVTSTEPPLEVSCHWP